jgi:LuxR family transcriptional regulator, maltose regulon positive regulatory protein
MSVIAGVPRVPPGAVARPRIREALDEGLPLCVLRSPGGMGKTTVLAQWVECAEHDHEAVVWVTNDLQTQSRAGFWVRVLTHLHHVGLLDDTTFYREVVTVADSSALVRDALVRVVASLRPVVLVIDNYAAAGEFWDDVSQDIITILRRAPSLRCIVAGRFPTLLEGPTAASAVETRVLDEGAMALVDDEVRDVVDHSGLVLDGDAVEAITTRTASRSVHELRYALELMQRRLDVPSQRVVTAADIAGSVPARVREDLAARIGDPDVLAFLGATSLAPHTDAALASQLAATLGTPGVGDSLLAELEREGIGFWSSTDEVGPAFRLSDHVRAVAAAQFAAEHPGRSTQVLGVVSRWLMADHHDPVGAIEYALRAGDLDFADHLVPRAFPLLGDDFPRLARQLEAIPGARVRSRPYLSMSYGLYLNARPGTQTRASEFFAAAALAARAKRPTLPRDERAVLLGMESSVWRLLGSPSRMLDRGRRAMREIGAAREDADLAQRSELDPMTAAVVSEVATTLFMGDDLAGSRRAFDAVSAIAAEEGWAHFANVAASGRAMLAVAEGRLDEARTELRSVRPEAWPASWLNAYVGSFRNIAQAWVHLDEGRPEAALNELALLDPQLDTIEHWELIASARAVAEALEGRVREAEARLNQVHRQRSRPTTLPSVRGRFASVRRIIQLASGTARGQTEHRIRGQSAAMDFALRAYVAAVHRVDADAVALLARAQLAATTPLHEAINAVVGIVVARRTGAGLDLETFGNQLAALVEAHGLHWPVMLLADADREALLETLRPELPGSAGAVLAAALATVRPIVSESLWEQSPRPTLTARERDVLGVLAETSARAEIAARLHVSVNTVKAQLRSTYTKLGVRTREEALTRAVALGLLEPETTTSDAAAAGSDGPAG